MLLAFRQGHELLPPVIQGPRRHAVLLGKRSGPAVTPLASQIQPLGSSIILVPAWRISPPGTSIARTCGQIEAGSVDQQPFQNVRVPSEMHAAHPAGVVQVRVWTFQQFAAFPQQPLPPPAVNAPPIRVHRVALGTLINPFLRRTIRFADVGAEAGLGRWGIGMLSVWPPPIDKPAIARCARSAITR
jgi:hypothetical protein